MDDFYQKVYEVTKKIPKGKVATYAQIARLVENSRAYRAVGQILRANPHPITVPCHRVISSDGSLGGYVIGLQKKARLLKEEGVEVKNNKIDLKKYGWKV